MSLTSTLYRVDVDTSYAAVAARWRSLADHGVALAFQRDTWLTNWYDTVGSQPEFKPLLLTIVEPSTGADVMALPLCLHSSAGWRAIEFADAGLTDYNAPILSAQAPQDAAGARAMWKAVLRRLPPADLIRLEKMPAEIGGRVNPLACLKGARKARLSGNLLRVEGEWNDWHWGLERTFRKELERSWRVFCKNLGAEFVRVADLQEATRVFTGLKTLQAARVAELGLPYILDEPVNERFYDSVVATGIASGDAVLTALRVGDRLVAALLGLATGEHYSMVRLATAGGEWKNCSPGRLLIERTMKYLHERGFRTFDFTIGDYAYKRRLGVSPLPLFELNTARSWRASPHVLCTKLKSRLRNHPHVAALREKLRLA